MITLYLVILVILNARFFIHTSVLVAPILDNHKKKNKNNKKILIQYPVMNEPIHLINRFIKSLENIPEEERYRFHIQVLDDYTKPLVLEEIPCISYEVLRRKSRTGRQEGQLGFAKSKAGNMNFGLQNLKDNFKYVMIYDADHQITSGKEIIQAAEILEANKEIIVVQSRWVFANTANTTCSWYQEATLGMHIDREQIFRSKYDLHPIMNGAGSMFKLDYVLKEFGGWLERGVVEDIDISYQITRKGLKVHVFPEWTTKIDNPDNWVDLCKQWEKWAQGNGQLLRYHLQESNVGIFKRLYWFSWLNSFNLAPFKYFFIIWGTYRFFYGEIISPLEYYCLVPHAWAWCATGLNHDNSFNLRRFILYPFQFIFELRILHVQIYNWYKGFLNYKQELEFKPTPKR